MADLCLEIEMETTNLFFMAYASHELDKLQKVFKQQTGNDPNAYVIRPDYVVSGSKENYKEIIMSRVGGYNCVLIPTVLTKAELDNIFLSMSEYRPPKRTIDLELSDECWDDDLTRYCRYCSKPFTVDSWKDYRMICEKPHCVELEKNRLEEVEKIKLSYKQEKKEETNEETKDELVERITSDDDDHYSETVSGWVYLIEADNGLCKIGHTDNVQKRFANLASMNAAGLSLRCTIFSANRLLSEQWLHKQFRNKLHHNEWFRLTNEDIAWIQTLQDGELDAV